MSDYFLNKIYDSLLSKKPVPKKPEPIVEKKETFKPLSKVYEVLIREANNHTAIYGKEGVPADPSKAPDYSNLGLQPLGIASTKMVQRIQQQVGMESGNVEQDITNVLKHGNLPANDEDLQLFVREQFIKANLKSPKQFLEYILKQNGVFEVPVSEKNVFDCIQLTLEGLNTFKDEFDKIKPLLKAFLMKQFRASTNVGSGELFFSVFSNAQVAGAKQTKTGETIEDGGGKSGDLRIGSNLVEVKATTQSGARLGGDGIANDALDEVPNLLTNISSAYKERGVYEKDIISKIITDLENISSQDLNNPEVFNQTKQQVENILRKANLSTIKRKDINKFNIAAQKGITFLGQPTTVDYEPAKQQPNKPSRLPSFIERFKSHLKGLLQERETELQQRQQQGQKFYTNYLDILLHDSINFIRVNQANLNVQNLYETLIQILMLVRNEKKAGAQLESQLKSIFPNTESIYKFTQTRENCNKLVGAIHLYCYSIITKPSHYLLLNTLAETNNSLIFKTPESLEATINFLNSTPQVSFDTRVDDKKTKRATSVNIEYYP
jgi:hypothetical protein